PVPRAEAEAETAAVAGVLLHRSASWWPGVVGFGDDAFTAKEVPCFTQKDVSSIVDGVLACCGTTSSDWSARCAALERLRGGLLTGLASVEGALPLIPRLRDALCVQVQELRSSLVKLACLTVSELFVVLGAASASDAAAAPPGSRYDEAAAVMDSMADALVDTLLKLTSVSIAVISTSADACVRSILRSMRVGCHRVIPRICAGCRAKGPVTRACAAAYLLLVLQGWESHILERHADDVQAVILTLLRDADRDARAAARLCYTALARHFPARGDSMLSSIDPKTQRMLFSDDVDAQLSESAVAYLCERKVSFFPAAASTSTPQPSSASSLQPPFRPPALRAQPAAASSVDTSPASTPTASSAAATPRAAAAAASSTPRVATAASVGTTAPPAATAARAALSSHATSMSRHLSAPQIWPSAATSPQHSSAAYDASPLTSTPPTATEASHDQIEALMSTPLSTLLAQLAAGVVPSATRGSSPSSTPSALRSQLVQLGMYLVAHGCVDARSLARGYGDRLPSVFLSAGIMDASSIATYAVTNTGAQPLLSDGFVRAGSVHELADVLLRGGSAATSSGLVQVLISCLCHPHDNVRLDALALLFAVLDCSVDVAGDLADDITSVLTCSALPPLAAGILPAQPAASASASTPAGPASVIRMFTLRSASGASDVVSAMPVFAGHLLPYIEVLVAVVIAHSTSATDAVRTCARRVIAALRRCFTVQQLLHTTLRLLQQGGELSPASPLAPDAFPPFAGHAAIVRHVCCTVRVQTACLMLLLSLLGDGSGGIQMLVTSGSHLRTLMERCAGMAVAATSIGSAGSTAGGASSVATGVIPAGKVNDFVNQIVGLLYRSAPDVLLSSVASLGHDHATLLARICDADTGGCIPRCVDVIRQLRSPSGGLAGVSAATAPQRVGAAVSAAPAPAAAAATAVAVSVSSVVGRAPLVPPASSSSATSGTSGSGSAGVSAASRYIASAATPVAAAAAAPAAPLAPASGSAAVRYAASASNAATAAATSLPPAIEPLSAAPASVSAPIDARATAAALAYRASAPPQLPPSTAAPSAAPSAATTSSAVRGAADSSTARAASSPAKPGSDGGLVAL
ncbi:MAG: hypothetical protein EOO41_00630, partial [Methanobacteriota archaeon]